MSRFTVAVLAAVLLGSPAVGSALVPPQAPQTPLTAEAMPMFAGLSLTSEEPMTGGGGGLTDGRDPYPFQSGVLRTFTTTTPAEEVYAFYLARLGGKIEHGSRDEHTRIGRGQATPVIRYVEFYTFEDVPNLDGQLITAARQRAMLAAGRPAMSTGEWLRDSSFSWVVKDEAGRLHKFHLKVYDQSVDGSWDRYAAKTIVETQVSHFGLMSEQ